MHLPDHVHRAFGRVFLFADIVVRFKYRVGFLVGNPVANEPVGIPLNETTRDGSVWCQCNSFSREPSSAHGLFRGVESNISAPSDSDKGVCLSSSADVFF